MLETIVTALESIDADVLQCAASALAGFAASFLRKKKKVTTSATVADLDNLIAYHQNCVDKLTKRRKELDK